MNWREQAACAGMDTEEFFPLGSSGPARAQTNQAKQVCAECPVAQQCLEFALSNAIDYGVFGGMSADERRRLGRDEPRANSPAREHEISQVLALCDGGLSPRDAARRTRLCAKTCREIWHTHRDQEVAR